VAVFFPVLMWIASILVAFFGLQRLVIRHIKKLRSALRKFALGDREQIGLNLDDPPEEIEEVQRAFNRMALIISEAETRQVQDQRDKDVLLKEVHHRVNNNLQLVASMMNIQSRKTSSKEAQAMLTSLQRRVRGMAMLLRTLYTTSDQTTIDAAELVQAVVDDVSSQTEESDLEVDVDLESVPLYPDQAVPLSMFVAEALPNALKFAGRTKDDEYDIHVTLVEVDDGTIRLTILNSLAEDTPNNGSKDLAKGLGLSLMTAFVRQLEGDMNVDLNEQGYCLEISFPRREFIASGRSDDAG